MPRERYTRGLTLPSSSEARSCTLPFSGCRRAYISRYRNGIVALRPYDVPSYDVLVECGGVLAGDTQMVTTCTIRCSTTAVCSGLPVLDRHTLRGNSCHPLLLSRHQLQSVANCRCSVLACISACLSTCRTKSCQMMLSKECLSSIPFLPRCVSLSCASLRNHMQGVCAAMRERV